MPNPNLTEPLLQTNAARLENDVSPQAVDCCVQLQSNPRTAYPIAIVCFFLSGLSFSNAILQCAAFSSPSFSASIPAVLKTLCLLSANNCQAPAVSTTSAVCALFQFSVARQFCIYERPVMGVAIVEEVSEGVVVGPDVHVMQ